MDVKNVSIANLSAMARRNVPSPVSRGASSPAQTAAPSAEALNITRYVSQSNKLSAPQKQSLINMAVQTEQFIDPTARSALQQNLVGLGIFLEQSSVTEYPRWELLTGLRYYSGIKIEVPSPPPAESQLLQNIQQQLTDLAKVSGGENVAQVFQQVAEQVKADPAVAQQIAQVISTGTTGGESAPAPATPSSGTDISV